MLFNLIERDTWNTFWDKLTCHYEHGETVPGTHSYHQLCPVSVDKIGYKQVNPKVSFDKISAIEYVACYYDSNWWAGVMQNVNCDENDFEINFLYPPGPSNNFTWSKRKDAYWVPHMNVICKVSSNNID